MLSCPLCFKKFDSLSKLNNHAVSHTNEKPYKCLQCSAAFGLAGLLERHVKNIHDGIKRIQKKDSYCPLCSYKGYDKSHLRIHLLKHSTEPPISCYMPGCGFKTKYNDCLLRHVRVVHSDDRPYKCPSDGCDYKGKTREYLQCHLRIHSKETPFKCLNCDFRTKSRSSLVQHQLTHREVKRFQCQAPNCGFASHQKYKVIRHFDAKHRKKNAKCTEPGCNYRCGSTILLQLHKKIHENRIFKCPCNSCRFSTKHKSSFRRHLSRQHRDLQSASNVGQQILDVGVIGPAGAVETLHCRMPNCGYQTKFPHLYDRHERTHNDEENHKHVCSFCFSRFRQLGMLRKHIQRHTGEKYYSCSQCNYATVDSLQLRKHARECHQIYVMPRGKEDEVRKCGTCNMNFRSHSEFVLHSMTHLQPVVVLEWLLVNVM